MRVRGSEAKGGMEWTGCAWQIGPGVPGRQGQVLQIGPTGYNTIIVGIISDPTLQSEQSRTEVAQRGLSILPAGNNAGL